MAGSVIFSHLCETCCRPAGARQFCRLPSQLVFWSQDVTDMWSSSLASEFNKEEESEEETWLTTETLIPAKKPEKPSIMPCACMHHRRRHTNKAGVAFMIATMKFWDEINESSTSSDPESINCRLMTADSLYILKGKSIHIIRKNVWHKRMLSSSTLLLLEREVTFGYLRD